MQKPRTLRELELYERFQHDKGLTGQALRDAWAKHEEPLIPSPKGSPGHPDIAAWQRRFIGGTIDLPKSKPHVKPAANLGMAPVYKTVVNKDEYGKPAWYTIFITPPAFMGSQSVHVNLTIEEYERFKDWRNGKGLIQNMLPGLSASDREKLMTGLDDEAFTRATRKE